MISRNKLNSVYKYSKGFQKELEEKGILIPKYTSTGRVHYSEKDLLFLKENYFITNNLVSRKQLKEAILVHTPGYVLASIFKQRELCSVGSFTAIRIILYYQKHIKKTDNLLKVLKPFLKVYGAESRFSTFRKLLATTTNMYDTKYVRLKHNLTEKEAVTYITKLKAVTAGTLSNFISRHGDIRGKRKFKEFSQKSAHTEESFIKRYGNNVGKSKYIKYCTTKDIHSLAYFIKKYGKKEGKTRYELNCKQLGYYSTIEYFIEKYGPKEGFTKYKEVSFSKGKTKDYFIRHYGEEYWNKLYLLKLKALGFDETFEKLEGFKAYRKRVHNLTAKLDGIWTLKNADKRAHSGEEAYHLDHKFSVYEAYRNNVPEYVVAHISNVEFIPAKDNISKGTKCSITLEQLYKGYESYENNKNNN